MNRKLKKGQKNARPILFCFWTGTNKLKSLKNTGLDIHFINVDNLDKYILKDHQLHSGYK